MNNQIQNHMVDTESLQRDYHDHMLKRNVALVTSSIDSSVQKSLFLEPRLYFLDEYDSMEQIEYKSLYLSGK